MIEAAHAVLLQDRQVGTLHQRGDIARFAFAEDYWSSADRHVLGLWFDDNPRQSPKAALRLPPWFSNLLPEGRMRDWIARDQGVSADRELQLLLRIGTDLPGAVIVVPNAGDPDLPATSVEVSPEAGRATTPVSRWKFSLAGVGLKFSMLREGDRLTVPGRDSLGDWIVKFPTGSLPEVPANEFAVMRLAAQVGIDVPEIDLVHRDQLPEMPAAVWQGNETRAFAIRRFDRAPGGRRIHIEDFTQVRGWYPDAKYDGAFETVAGLAFRGRDRIALREFVRRLVFNLLIGNGDAHLKNWSLIYPDGRIPTLSPAYDLVSTGPYYPAHEPENLGLTLGGHRTFSDVRRAAFVRLQRKLQADDADVIDVVAETVERFFNHWDQDPPEPLPSFVADWITPHAERMRKQLVR